MRDRIEYCLVISILSFTKLLPVSLVYQLFDSLAWLVFKLAKGRRKIAIENLSNAYPKLSKEEIESLALKNFKSVGITVAEILLIFTKRFDIENAIINKEEFLKKLNSMPKDKGIIFVTAHYANWEILALFISKSGYPMSAIGRKGNNHLIEEKLTKPFREQYGTKNIYKKQAMIQMIKTLKRKGNVGLLIDQKAGHLNSARVDFFNKPTNTTISVATMKLKYDALVLPIFIIRKESGLYEIIFDKQIDYVADEEESKEDKIKAMTQKYNDVFEEVVRKAPEQWFWMHNRWKV